MKLRKSPFSLTDPLTEAFSVAGELIAEVFKDLAGRDPKVQGIMLGRMVFEIAAIFIPVSKITAAAKLTKLEFLGKAKAGGGFIKEYAIKLFNFERVLEKTKMCFVAGTMVMSAHGMQAIETVQAGDVVWSKCEVTHQEGWKPVLDTFITNPSELYHLGVDYDGDHKVDETLTGTGEHPFYLTNRTEAGFFSLRELKRYDQLVLAHGKNAQVISLNTERGPPSETFTTYNFEVADYHTYFVGENGVWVHNLGDVDCQKVFSHFNQKRSKHGDDIWDSYDDLILNPTSDLQNMNRRWNLLAANEATKEALAGSGNLNKAPWKRLTGQTRNSNGVKKTEAFRENMRKAWGMNEKGFPADNIDDVTRFEAHHIIPPLSNNPKTQRLKEILDNYGIDVNEAANGVYLPKKGGLKGNIHDTYGQYHGNHTTTGPGNYLDTILQELEAAHAVAIDANDMRDKIQIVGRKVFSGEISL